MYAAACAQPALLPCSTSTSISIVELNETERLISSSISLQVLTCFENMAKAICIELSNSSNIQNELRLPV